MSSQMAVDATDGRDASVICVKGHICSEHHFGEEQQKTLHCICTECGTRLNGSHSFRCSTCNYYVCDSCTAAVRQLASSRRWPMFCLDLPAFVACSNAVAIPLFRRMLRRLRPAAHPPPLLLRSSLMHGPLPVQLTHRARVRVHRVGLTLMLVLRLLRSSQTVVDGRMCAFASGILRRLSGGGCSIVRAAAGHFIARAANMYRVSDAVAADDVLSCSALFHSQAHPDIEQRDPNSLETPLQLAVAHSAISGARQCKVLQFLLHARADVNAVDDSRSTPLHAACVADDAETALLLLNAKADVVARNSRGHTPLHVAACQGSVTAAQCVLTAGADINAAAGRDKFTALHFAVVNGHIDMLLCLLDAGADCSARDGFGRTPLALASVEGYVQAEQTLLAKEVSKRATEAGEML